MCRFLRRWLLYNRVHGCIRCAGRSQCNIYAHFDWLKAACHSTLSQMLAINPHHQPLQLSEPATFRLYAAMRRVMHQPLSRFSTCPGKCVDYVDTSQKARQTGLSPQTGSVRHVYDPKSTTAQDRSSAIQDRLPGIELNGRIRRQRLRNEGHAVSLTLKLPAAQCIEPN